MLQKAFMAGGEGGWGGGSDNKNPAQTSSTCRKTSMYTSAYTDQPRPQGFSLKKFFKGKALGTRLYTDNYRQFLIKIKYICDSGSLSFNFVISKIDVEQLATIKEHQEM